MGRKLTTEEWVSRAKALYGDTVDFSKVVYINSDTKVTLICPTHGEFETRPYSFMQGHGCPKCGKEKASRKISHTSNEFIEKAREIHGNKYDYSKVEYINNRTKVCIICPEHGEFWQIPYDHLQGRGCTTCGYYIAGNKVVTTEDFIARAREIHGDRYDYSQVVYTKTLNKVIIVCPEHGAFQQAAHSHLSGNGCPHCAKNHLAEMYKFSKEQFINNSKYWHGNYYDYSKVDYINNYTPVTIICPIHGEFQQTPSNHMAGRGCSLCNKMSAGEQAVYDFLKSKNIEFITQYKLQSTVNQSGFMFVDFYLPEYNTYIEYNGIQHYVPVDYMGGQLQFEKQQRRDSELRQYCEHNNINLIEIRYDEDVWETLNKKLCK